MIADLDDIYRDVLILQYRYHMKNKEIAEILKISENTVGVRLYRAKQILLQERRTELDEIRKK
jgi:RNA polymerase sigma factor (sigma-70 family)